jgi:hypothetical protein
MGSNNSDTMSLTVLPLEQDEIPRYVRIELEAFRSHPRIPMMWPRGYTDDLYAFYEASKTKSFEDPECRFMKAVDKQTGDIVAVSEWTFALDPVKNAGAEPVDPNGLAPDNWPVAGNWGIRRFFTLNLEKWRKIHLAGKPYIRMSLFSSAAVWLLTIKQNSIS